jgi:hypothetical protein
MNAKMLKCGRYGFENSDVPLEWHMPTRHTNDNAPLQMIDKSIKEEKERQALLQKEEEKRLAKETEARKKQQEQQQQAATKAASQAQADKEKKELEAKNLLLKKEQAAQAAKMVTKCKHTPLEFPCFSGPNLGIL